MGQPPASPFVEGAGRMGQDEENRPMTRWHCHRCAATFTRWAGADRHARETGHGVEALTLRSGSRPEPVQTQIW